MSEPQWFYANGQSQVGPYGQSQLAEAFRSGSLPGGTLVWRAGMQGWHPAAQTPEFAGSVPPGTAGPPPLPHAPGAPAAASRAEGGGRSPWLWVLVGVVIVLVGLPVVGIMAAIAIPKFANTKEKAYVASMKSDLRNLVTAQEAYFADNSSVYAPSVEALGPSRYRASTGVTVTINSGSDTGWDATAVHSGLPATKICAISVGGMATNEGEPVCQ